MIAGVDVRMRAVALVREDQTVAVWTTGLKTSLVSILEQVDVWAADLASPRDVVAVELPVVAGRRNLQSTIKLAMVTGAVMAGLRRGGAAVHPVSIDTWKKEICGKGGIGKPEVASWVREHWPVFAGRTEDIALGIRQDVLDAFCISLWAQALSQAP